MGNHQTNQSGRKSSKVSDVRLWGLLLVGVLLCGLSFFGDQVVIQWVKTHDSKSLRDLAGFLSRWGDWPELMLYGCLGLGFAWLARSRGVCRGFFFVWFCVFVSRGVA